MSSVPPSPLADSPSQSSPSQSSSTPATIMQGYVPHQQLLSCIHCGLCTSSCPTYLITGNENDSPRGRIHLMRSVEEGRIELNEKVRGHLDLCLDCRSCETACPSGVQYGQLIETFRISDRQKREEQGENTSGWFEKLFLHGIFTDRRRLERVLWPARLMQITGMNWAVEKAGLVNFLPSPLRRMQRMLPTLKKDQPPLPQVLFTDVVPRRARVGLFLGCVSDAMFRNVHWATARVLQKVGCEVLIPDHQQCCGAIEFHTNEVEAARKKAHKNRTAFEDAQVQAVIVNVAGCGAMLKEYSHLVPIQDQNSTEAQQLTAFSKQVFDVHEYLAKCELPGPLGALPLRVVYQDACHLRHAQQIEQPPRQLLRQIPGLELLEILEPNICCGAAGSYNLQQPEMSDQLGERKINHILSQKPDVIVSGNAGCALQLQALLKQRGLKIPVVHTVELLDASLQQLSWGDYQKQYG